MSFARPKTVIEENDTVILYLTLHSLHAIDVLEQQLPYIKNKKDELVENVFQTSYGALKIKELIGVKYGSKVNITNYIFDSLFFIFIFKIITFRSNCRRDGHTCCSQHRHYGHKLCHIEHKSSIHLTLVWFYFNWKSNQAALLLNQALEVAHYHIHFYVLSNHISLRLVICLYYAWNKLQRYWFKLYFFTFTPGLSPWCVRKRIHGWAQWKSWCRILGFASTTFGRTTCAQSIKTFR